MGDVIDLAEASDLFNPQPDLVKQLLKNGVKANAVKEGYPALVWAYDPPGQMHAVDARLFWSQKNSQVMRLLLENGANPNVQDSNDGSPLMFASSRGDIFMVKLLLKHGARVNYHTPISPAALFVGVEHANVERFLLDHGASLSTRDTAGYKPLHYASISGSLETIKLFVQRGAKVNVRNDRGQTPLMYEAGRSGPEAVAAIRFLIAHGAKVQGRDKNGDTPLHLCMSSGGDPNVIRELVKYGADVNVQDNRGWTPLMESSQGGQNRDGMRTLVALRADVKLKGKKGETALTLMPGLKAVLLQPKSTGNKQK